MSQTGYFVGWSFLFNFELNIFLLCNTPQWFMSCFFVDFFMCPLQGYAFLRILHSSLWCLQLVASQTLEYQKLMPLSCRRRQYAAQSPSRLFSSEVFVVPITSVGALPPSYAGRPIISPSLGIDQRAGESLLWGRGRAALITSARSAEGLSAQRDTRNSEDEEMSHIGRIFQHYD